MEAVPTRVSLVSDRLIFAAIGASVPGAADSLNILMGTRLFLGFGDQLLLSMAGAAEGALVGAALGLALALFPRRPRGRSRWLAFLTGLAGWWFLAGAVFVLSDPAPFTEPARFQGQPAALLGLGLALGVGILGLYQGVRGARPVSITATILVAVHGIQAWSAPGLASSSAVAPPKGKPNVLLVTLDTTRADRIGVYGNPEVATPVMDELANTGVRFVNASAVAAVTGPSHSSMLSGLAPWRSGVLLNGVALPSDQTMLAERLAEFGYSTAAFVSAYVLDGNLGFSRGFSVYDDEFSWLRGGGLLRPARAFAMFARRADPNAVLERRGGETVDLALSWLAEQGDKPWFLWVHLFDPHGPYAPPPPFDTRYYSGDENDPGHTSMQQVTGVAPYLERSLRGVTDLDFVLAQYAGEISYADSQIGRLVAEVSRSQTVIAVIGDHGESLGEHGVWFNHGDDVYESSVHVPFILNWAGTLPPSVLTSPVEGTDLATTLLARLGLPALGDGVDAVAATRVEAGSMCFDRATNLAERAAGRIEQPTFRIASVRGENARFIHREFDSRLEYFDLAAEPAGLLNSEPGFRQTEAGTALLPILQSHTAAMLAGDTSRSSAEVSDEERLKLEALGYLDQ